MKHWTEDDITQWLYGLIEDCGHLDQCDSCRAKSQQAQTIRQKQIQAGREVPADFLDAQRRAIYARMQQRPARWFSYLRIRWAASLALVLLAAVMSLHLLRRPSYAPLATPADVRLYSDMAAIDQSSEPRAIRPIENLFEE